MCDHKLGTLPCVNPIAHPGDGRGCVHIHGSYLSTPSDEEE